MEEIFDRLKAYSTWWLNGGVDPRLVGQRRSLYFNRIEPLLPTREIIELIGVRRAGKTTIMYQLIDHLIFTGTDPKTILYAQLDDPVLQLALKGSVDPIETLLNHYFELYEKVGKKYILLDEIQTIPKFAGYLKRFYETDRDLKFIISGSNTTLLQDESTRGLVGRTARIKVMPFSFKEILHMRNINYNEKIARDNKQIKTELNYYLKLGGMPEVIVGQMEMEKNFAGSKPEDGRKGYGAVGAKKLLDYFTDILHKDVEKVYAIRDSKTLEQVAAYLIMHPGQKTNSRSLASGLGANKDTVSDYVEYLKKSLLFLEVPHYSNSGKGTARKDRKYYAADLGMINALAGKREDYFYGLLAENAVLIKLLEKYDAAYYWQGRNECDFIVEQFGEKLAVEVKYQKQEHGGEINGLLEAMEKLRINRGIVVTKDSTKTEEIRGKKVKFISLWEFLLDLY